MSYCFVFTVWFDRNLKSLRKHNPNLRSDFESFLKTFDAQAHPVIPLFRRRKSHSRTDSKNTVVLNAQK